MWFRRIALGALIVTTTSCNALLDLHEGQPRDTGRAETDAWSDGQIEDRGIDAPQSPARGLSYFQLRGGADPESTAGGRLNCPGAGTVVTVSTKGSEGVEVPLVDGVGGAIVTCRLDAKHFSVKVASAFGGFEGSGTLQTVSGTTSSKNMQATFAVLSPFIYATRAVACTVEVRELGVDVIEAAMNCPKVEHVSLPDNACAVLALYEAFFRFERCSGF